MTEDFFNYTMPVCFETRLETQPGDLQITVQPASEKAAPGEPGKAVGDLVLQTQPDGGKTVVVSLGSKEPRTAETFRKAGGALGKWLVKNEVRQAALAVDSFDRFGVENAITAFLEGIRLGSYRFDKRKKKETLAETTVVLSGAGEEEQQELIRRVTAITHAVALARDWGHEPANILNPATLAERAQALAERYGLKITVFDDTQLKEMGAGAIVGVGLGSKTGSRMIILEYRGTNEGNQQPVALVGKAITFDTGGYSIKSVDSIKGMKYDKMGGIAVLATLAAAAELKLGTPIVGIVCAAENMVSDQAYRPDDILTSLSGKTIEIITTDAEGRLVLADGLTYAERTFQPRTIIDLATLTGGVVTALGSVRAGIMSNNEDLSQALIRAGDATFERLWPLPLDDEYAEFIKSDDADLKNSGGKAGHPIMGGIFLKQFIENGTPWAHLDIAGVADSDKELPYSSKGATGFGVRLLIHYLESLQ